MQTADLVRKQRIFTGAGARQFGVYVQRPAADFQKVDAVRRGRREFDVQTADGLTRRTVLIAFVRRDQENLFTLLTIAHGDELQQVGLSRTGHTENGHIGVAVSVSVKNIEHTDRMIAQVLTDEDTVLFAKLHRIEWKCACRTGKQRVPSGFAGDLRRRSDYRQE